VHECLHPLRKHFARAAAANIPMREANICQDAEINDGSKLRKFLPSTGIIYPEDFGWKPGKTFEEYWQNYPKQEPEGAGEGVANGDCGSGASGEPQPYELPPPSEGGPGLDEVDMEVIRRQVAKDVKRAAGSDPDSVGGSSLRWATDVLSPPIIPWQSVLRRHSKRFREWMKGNLTTTYTRMSRRNSDPRKLCRPGMTDPVPNIAVAVDTSGSMDAEIGAQVLAEVQSCLRAGSGSGGTVLVCDAQMQGLKKVKHVREMEFRGGGGTDMRVVIEAAAKLRNRPDYLVILTDGHSPWPKSPPRHMRVVIGLIGAWKANPERLPTWAKVIDIPNN
jgi:predicted metal-dependent peptidase